MAAPVSVVSRHAVSGALSGPQGTYWSEEHGGFLAEDERATGVIDPATWKAFCERADVDEIFSRYDVDGDGVLCAGDSLTDRLTDRLTHSLAHALPHSTTHVYSLAHTLTQPLNHTHIY